MRVLLNFDEELMRRYWERGSQPIFGIAWEQDGTCYPSCDWIDFGAVILGWWQTQIFELLRGAQSAEFVFMDGPYSIAARKDLRMGAAVLIPRGEDFEWRVPLPQLVEELIRASVEVSRELERLGVAGADAAALTRGAEMIRAVMKSAPPPS